MGSKLRCSFDIKSYKNITRKGALNCNPNEIMVWLKHHPFYLLIMILSKKKKKTKQTCWLWSFYHLSYRHYKKDAPPQCKPNDIIVWLTPTILTSLLDEFISIACSLFVNYNLLKNHLSTDKLALETKSLRTPFGIHR